MYEICYRFNLCCDDVLCEYSISDLDYSFEFDASTDKITISWLQSENLLTGDNGINDIIYGQTSTVPPLSIHSVYHFGFVAQAEGNAYMKVTIGTPATANWGSFHFAVIQTGDPSYSYNTYENKYTPQGEYLIQYNFLGNKYNAGLYYDNSTHSVVVVVADAGFETYPESLYNTYVNQTFACKPYDC